MLHNRFLTYLLIAVFAISAVFTSCKPDDDDNGNTDVQLVKTVISGDYHMSFEYDDKNRITVVNVGDKTISRTYVQLMYSGNDLVKFILNGSYGENDEYVADFLKDGNIITLLGQDGYTTTFELNSDGYLVNYGGTTWQYLNGNMVSVFSADWSWAYKYDNQKSPFYHCKTPKWFLVFFNSLIVDGAFPFFYSIKNNFTEAYRNEYEHTREEYTYEYDNNSFATKMYRDGKLQFTFIYQ